LSNPTVRPGKPAASKYSAEQTAVARDLQTEDMCDGAADIGIAGRRFINKPGLKVRADRLLKVHCHLSRLSPVSFDRCILTID